MQEGTALSRFKKRKIAVITTIVAVLGGIGAGAAVAAGGGDDDATDTPISGAALDQAKAAALGFHRRRAGHRTEVGDEQSYYEVEVTLENGEQIDVHLDKSFNVVNSKGDGPETGGDDGPDGG